MFVSDIAFAIPTASFISGIIPANKKNKNRPELKRFKGIQANSSALNPDELNNCSILYENNYKSMADDMLFLKKEFNFNIFGGCCGTNDKFIDDLAKSLKV